MKFTKNLIKKKVVVLASHMLYYTCSMGAQIRVDALHNPLCLLSDWTQKNFFLCLVCRAVMGKRLK